MLWLPHKKKLINCFLLPKKAFKKLRFSIPKQRFSLFHSPHLLHLNQKQKTVTFICVDWWKLMLNINESILKSLNEKKRKKKYKKQSQRNSFQFSQDFLYIIWFSLKKITLFFPSNSDQMKLQFKFCYFVIIKIELKTISLNNTRPKFPFFLFVHPWNPHRDIQINNNKKLNKLSS